MTIPPCPMGGRKKRRAILESSEEQGLNISPSPSVELDIKRWVRIFYFKDIQAIKKLDFVNMPINIYCSSGESFLGMERAARYYPYWITTTLRPTETKYFDDAQWWSKWLFTSQTFICLWHIQKYCFDWSHCMVHPNSHDRCQLHSHGLHLRHVSHNVVGSDSQEVRRTQHL